MLSLRAIALGASIALLPALAAMAMGQRPASLPVDAPPAPTWLQARPLQAAVGQGELRMRWLGTAGFEFRSAKAAILIDPYFSRLSLGKLLEGPYQPDRAAIARYTQRPVQAVFVSHSHFDHAADAPAVAKFANAPLYGSATTLKMAEPEGLAPSQLKSMVVGKPITIGDMEVEAVACRHSDLPTQLLVGGEMPTEFRMPLSFLAYKNSTVYGLFVRWRGRTIYHAGSADSIEANLAGKHADVVLVCVSGWTSNPGIFGMLYNTLHPSVIGPMHHDDFFRPFEGGVTENALAAYAGGLKRIRQDAPGAALLTHTFFDDHRIVAKD